MAAETKFVFFSSGNLKKCCWKSQALIFFTRKVFWTFHFVLKKSEFWLLSNRSREKKQKHRLKELYLPYSLNDCLLQFWESLCFFVGLSSFSTWTKKKGKIKLYWRECLFFFETFQKMFVFFSCVIKNKKDVLTRKKKHCLFQKKTFNDIKNIVLFFFDNDEKKSKLYPCLWI